MPLPSTFNTITVFDEFMDLRGRAVTGSGTIVGSKVRKAVATGLNIVPVPIPFEITQQTRTIGGQSLSVGYFTVDVPLSDDADFDNADTYTVTLNLTGSDRLLAGVGPFTVLLTADLGSPVRLTDLMPAGPVAELTRYLTQATADARYALKGEGGGSTTTSASNLTSGTLSPDRIAAGSIAAAKLAPDVATQAELDALASSIPSTYVSQAALDAALDDVVAAGQADTVLFKQPTAPPAPAPGVTAIWIKGA